MQDHKYSLTEVEGLIPFERAIYVDMLNDWLEKKNKEIQQE